MAWSCGPEMIFFLGIFFSVPCNQIQLETNVENLSDFILNMADNTLNHKNWWFGNGYSLYYRRDKKWELTDYVRPYISEESLNDFPTSGTYFDENENEYEININCIFEEKEEGENI